MNEQLETLITTLDENVSKVLEKQRMDNKVASSLNTILETLGVSKHLNKDFASRSGLSPGDIYYDLTETILKVV